MKALTWHGKGDIRCETVADPKVEHGRDAIIKVCACAICGSDLHLFDGIVPTMEKGDVMGHETMGEVVEVGPENSALKVGDRVVVPFTISCGECFFCKRGFYSGCERSNPNAKEAEKLWGHSPAGLFGYSHMLGGFAGGQAEYLRVPYADVGPVKVPESLSDDQVLFLSDIFPTDYMAADFCDLKGGDTVAVWGCGPVGQFAIKSALLLGAERVIHKPAHLWDAEVKAQKKIKNRLEELSPELVTKINTYLNSQKLEEKNILTILQEISRIAKLRWYDIASALKTTTSQ